MAFYHAEDGCRIHYQCFGSKGPAVLLIPGLGGDGRFWNGVIARLEQDFRLIVTDHRGAGQSDRPQTGYSIPLIARDIAGLIESRGEPVHVVGHSTGGAVAQVLALDHEALGLSYTISSSWARSDARFRNLFQARAELIDAGLTETYQRLTQIFGYTAKWLAENETFCTEAITAAARNLAPLPVTAARIRMLLAHDRLNDLSRIDRRVQVIAAEQDILTPPALSQMIATAIPAAEFVRIAGAHFHPQTDPEQFASLIRQFILAGSDKS